MTSHLVLRQSGDVGPGPFIGCADQFEDSLQLLINITAWEQRSTAVGHFWMEEREREEGRVGRGSKGRRRDGVYRIGEWYILYIPAKMQPADQMSMEVV